QVGHAVDHRSGDVAVRHRLAAPGVEAGFVDELAVHEAAAVTPPDVGDQVVEHRGGAGQPPRCGVDPCVVGQLDAPEPGEDRVGADGFGVEQGGGPRHGVVGVFRTRTRLVDRTGVRHPINLPPPEQGAHPAHDHGDVEHDGEHAQ